MTYKKQIKNILPEILTTEVAVTHSGTKITYDEFVENGKKLGVETTRRKWYAFIMETHYDLYQTWAKKALNQLLDELEEA